jgi:hypothetical protein
MLVFSYFLINQSLDGAAPGTLGQLGNFMAPGLNAGLGGEQNLNSLGHLTNTNNFLLLL